MSVSDPSNPPPSSTDPLLTPAHPLAETLVPTAPLTGGQMPPTQPPFSGAGSATLPPSVPALAPSTPAGVVVPGYEILGELGRGGMGVVYKARQVKADRLVALKMILSGAHASAEDLKRFQVEAEAVARLRHPNIVAVYDVGENQGLPFFSLEFCAGGSLEKKLRDSPLKPAEAAHIVEALARAMATAHEQRVIHRDLKPGNVLLLEDGTPKVTDFGLARKLDEAGQTQSGSIMGTPSYMAPEQASGKVKEIGPAADTYALGAVLYECLTGRPPFKAATPLDTVLQVISDEPVPPTQLNPKTPRDLETICLKCLQKEVGKRYASALDLAEDLRRFQAGEPITARPVGRLERTWRWCKRYPAVSALLVVSFAFGLTMLYLFGQARALRENEAEARRAAEHSAEQEKQAKKDALDAKGAADEQRKRAEAALERAETALYFNRVRQADQALQAGKTALAAAVLDECRLDMRRWEWRLLRRGAGLKGVKLDGAGAVNGLAFSADGKTLATAGADRSVRLWDASTGKPQGAPLKHPEAVAAVAFHPAGRQLATACADGSVRLWETGSDREPRALAGHRDAVLALAYSPDGRWLASGSKDVTTMLWSLDGKQPPRTLGGHSNAVAAVAFSPDSRVLLTASVDGTAKLWQVSDGRLLRTLRGHSLPILSVAFSDSGKEVFTGSLDGTVREFETATGKTLRVLRGNRGGVAVRHARIAAPAGQQILLWDVTTGQEVLALAGPDRQEVGQVAFSPSGRLAAVWSDPRRAGTGEVRIWDATPLPERFVVHPRGLHVGTAALGPGGRLLATAGYGVHIQSGSVQLWDTATGLEVRSMEGHVGAVTCVAFRPDGRRLATGSADCSLMTWDAGTGKSVQTIVAHRKPVLNLVYSPDGRRLASVAGDGRVCIADPDTGKVLLTLPGHAPESPALAFSGDGKRFAALSETGDILVRDSERGEPVAGLKAAGRVVALTFSPDGRRLASVGPGTAVRVWDIETSKAVLRLQVEGIFPVGVAFEAGGRELSVLGSDGRVQVWDAQTGNLLRSEPNSVSAGETALARDPRFVITRGRDGTVRVWNRPTRGHPGAE